MPNSPIAEDIRLRLAQTMPLVERRKADVTARMEERLQAPEERDEAFGQAEITAAMLVELLIDGASDIAAFGGLRELAPVSREHRRLDIDGRHYSRFGLALGPVLRATLGLGMPPETVAAWCDAFWIIIAGLANEELQSGGRRRRAGLGPPGEQLSSR